MIVLSQGGLVAAFVLTALLLLGVNLYSNFSWRIKITLIVVVSAFYVGFYYSLPPLMGWPTNDDLPKRFNLIATYVEEPDKKTGEAGHIFLWVTDFRKGSGRSEPRAYRIPFEYDLHAKLVAAGTKVRKGIPQLGEVVDEKPGTAGRPSYESNNGQESTGIDFFDLPDPLIPEK
jgi:hypothetical protein